MSKNQIIAKAMLCGIGFYAVAGFLPYFMMTGSFSDNAWETAVHLVIYSAVFFIVCRVLIFNSDKLAEKICGSCEDLEDFDRRAYLVKSFRIVFVAVGLSQLSSSRLILVFVYIMQSFPQLLPKIRTWFRDLIQTGDFHMPVVSLKELNGMVSMLKIILVLYMIFGGAFIIKWHLKRSGLTNNKELSNE